EAGRFREDLFYRLHVIPMTLPPLREREGDAMEIARHFLAQYVREEGKRFTRFAPEVATSLQAHNWPGNVRELQNVVRNIVVLNDGETVTLDMLPPLIKRQATNGAPSSPQRAEEKAEPVNGRNGGNGVRPLWLVEKEAIESAISACEGNVPRAAALLEISPSTIYRKRLAWVDSHR